MRTLKWRTIWILALIAISSFFLIPRNVTQRVYDPASGRMRDTTLRRIPIELGLDLQGGMHIALEIDPSKQTAVDCADAIKRAERVIRTRIDEFGTSEPVVQIVGDCRLIVELPGVRDPARARSIVQRTAFLEFRLTDARGDFQRALPVMDAALRRAGISVGGDGGRNVIAGLLRDTSGSMQAGSTTDRPLSSLLTAGEIPGEFFVVESNVPLVDSLLAHAEVRRLIPRGLEVRWGAHVIPNGREPSRALYALSNRPIITGEALNQARAGRDPMTNAAEVQFELTRAGGRTFAAATARNVGNHVAIVLDRRVQGPPPVITTQIETNGLIKLNGTLEEANDLALVLRAGALPAPLQVVEERSLGPSLGQDSIRDGVRASGLAVGFVLLVMGVYYGVSGLLAVGALFLYIVFCLGGLAAFGFALTLPGLAGFALSIGMAVDANVLIFERIREEMDAGKPVRVAVNKGFSHAMGAIVDSNVTTAVTAVILYLVGTRPVQGFAITLLVGLCASMLSAVFVTRTFFLAWITRKPTMTRLKGFTLRLFAHANFDFIGTRKLAYAVSAAFILPGAIVLAMHGPRYSIEFTGGALIQVRTTNAVPPDALRAALGGGVLGRPEIQRFGSERDYVIRARLQDASGTDEAQTAAVTSAVREGLDRALGAGAYEITRSEAVGPKVGGELREKAAVAVLFSFATTLVYLAARFEWRFGLAAVIATAHDVLATLAFIIYLKLEVSLVVVAALLTVLGYSLNDTIVIFDRIRENLRDGPRRAFTEVLNVSINETLPRTILTGGTTLATAVVLSFFAGEVIKPFALVMTFGIVVGTFSSIFIAAPVLLWIRRRWGGAESTKYVDGSSRDVLAR
jgi:protein-export membrane protein SecD/preprotein translocase SecF subunit